MSIQRIFFNRLELNKIFTDISDELGFSEKRINDDYFLSFLTLIQIWESQKYVDVYIDNSDRQYGRAKDSNSVLGSSPFYTGLYHARVVNGCNDPLVVIKFMPEQFDNTLKYLSIRFFIHHDDMFGANSAIKNNKAKMRQIRMRVDGYIQRAENS